VVALDHPQNWLDARKKISKKKCNGLGSLYNKQQNDTEKLLYKQIFLSKHD